MRICRSSNGWQRWSRRSPPSCNHAPRKDDANGIRYSDRKSTRLNSSHVEISYAVFCLKKKTGAVRLSWGTGVVQREVQIEADSWGGIIGIGPRGTFWLTLFAWSGSRYGCLAGMVGAGG